MNHGIGRAADGAHGANSIFKSLARQDLRHAQIFIDHGDNPPAGEVRQRVAAGIGRGNGGVRRQSHPQSFDHARHGGGGPHGHAMSGRAAHAGFGIHEFAHGHGAGADVFAELPDISSRPDVASAKFAVEHGAAGEHQGRQVATGGAHQQGGGGFVAAGKEHDAV